MASAYSISPVKSTIGGGDANLQKKIEYLTQEMKAIDVNHDQFISREELYNYLDKKVLHLAEHISHHSVLLVW